MNQRVGAPARSALIPDAAARAGNDPIFALHAEATARASAGESVLNATLGALLTDDGELAVIPTASEAFVQVPSRAAAAYAPIAGDPAFLSAVVKDLFPEAGLARKAVAVATAGATGAIHHAMANFVDPGDAALAPSYYWGPYRAIAEHAHKRIETFRMFDGDGRFDLRAFETGLMELLGRQGRALVLFNFPCNNPTGYSLDPDEWVEVARIVRDAGDTGPVSFLIDYAYGSFGGPTSGGWVKCIDTMLESATVLVAWTASKSFTQYGSRVGALVALHEASDERARIEAALGYSCRGTWSNCNHRGLLAVTELLVNPELKNRAGAERAELVALLSERAAIFNRAAAGTSITYPRYEGGFFVSVFTPDSEVTAARMRELGVYVVPIPGAVRAALCATPSAEVTRLVEALAEGVAAAEAA